MVVGVVQLALLARDDPPCAVIRRSGRLHRVLVVIAVRPGRQQTLSILEYGAILAIGERPAALNQRDRIPRRNRQLVVSDRREPAQRDRRRRWRPTGLCGRRRSGWRAPGCRFMCGCRVAWTGVGRRRRAVKAGLVRRRTVRVGAAVRLSGLGRPYHRQRKPPAPR